ncbi:nucleoside recognition protein [Alkaliphilus sp. MSJ-5]|uniref:Nucleoside recognition protein n=1 Tax=Alkaliphilus flagellatus TaxID=2841507 RepID=A0ABS6G755_9FIRM|nr:nucleoside recognition domain-containing protein [Alkaliphilus flagellatus]MBU5677265.1 nucleoside recognition protein [Alkaliphilus flagellatus]
MINVIWFLMIAVGVIVGAVNGNILAVTDSAINSAKTAVEISIGLIGVMALWLGIMKIAEESGLVKSLAKALRFIMVPLFPDVPEDHPAMGAMIMNIAANILGLGNAATPLGLKAMQELQELNPTDDTATDAMVTFLAINTSSVTLIPASVIAIRAAAGSANATEIIGPTIVATTASTVAALIAVKLLQKLPVFQMKLQNQKLNN